MTKPKPLNDWQRENTPAELPLHMRRNIGPGEGGCWLWLRSKSRDGYGWASLEDRTYQAHRLVYRLLRGEPSDGLVLDHLCRIRHCVNPHHMEEVTNHENLLRGETTATRRFCLKCGDALTMHHGGVRRCKECYRVQSLENAKKRRNRRKEMA